MLISVIYATNISSVGVHLAKFTPFPPHFNKNCLEKFFPVALGVHLHPLHPPGYAYARIIIIIIIIIIITFLVCGVPVQRRPWVHYNINARTSTPRALQTKLRLFQVLVMSVIL